MLSKYHCGDTDPASSRQGAPWATMQATSSHPQRLIAARTTTPRAAMEPWKSWSPNAEFPSSGLRTQAEACSKTQRLLSCPGLLGSSTLWSEKLWGCQDNPEPPGDLVSAMEDPPTRCGNHPSLLLVEFSGFGESSSELSHEICLRLSRLAFSNLC